MDRNAHRGRQSGGEKKPDQQRKEKEKDPERKTRTDRQVGEKNSGEVRAGLGCKNSGPGRSKQGGLEADPVPELDMHGSGPGSVVKGQKSWDFPGSLVVKISPSNAGVPPNQKTKT